MPKLGQNGSVKIIPILLIVAVVGLISFLLIASTATFQNSNLANLYPKVPSHAATTCSAGDLVTLSKCMQQAKAGQVSSVEISNMIDCSTTTQNGADNGPFNGTGSGGIGCNYNLDNVTTPITIYGRAGTLAGFKRSNFYRYNIFHLGNSQNITISNLIFDDGLTPCPGSPSSSYCETPIRVENGKNLTFDHLLIENIKAMGIEITPSANITVTNSIFYHIGQGSGQTSNGFSGIWFGQDTNTPNVGTNGIQIKNNLFKDLEGPGFFFGALNGSNNVIDGNFFDHTHILRDYGPVCPNYCGGGQLVFSFIMSGLTISNNVIVNGQKDADPTNQCCTTSGIEIDDEAHNVTITGNDIHNNSGEAVGVEFGRSYSNIVVSNNKTYYDSLVSQFPAFNMDGNVTLSNNCTTPTCMLVTKGIIFGANNPCIIPLGASNCTSHLVWVTNDAPNVYVNYGSNTYANLTAGSYDLPGITDQAGGTTFILASNGTPMAPGAVIIGLKPYYSLAANPNPCIIATGQSNCDSKISWATAFLNNVTVHVDGGIYDPNDANNINGDAPWIGTGGNTFQIYSGTTPLTSLLVKGVPAPTPTPAPLPTATPTPAPTIAPTSAPTPSPTTAPAQTLGNTHIGSIADSGDSNEMDGSRITIPTFASGTPFISVYKASVYVGNVDASTAHRSYQIYIYTDSGGKPGTLVAQSPIGTLVPNSWNTVAFSAINLATGSSYWLMYNTNGTNGSVNNLQKDPVSTPIGAWSNNAVTFGNIPFPFPPFGPSTLENSNWSIYINYF